MVGLNYFFIELDNPSGIYHAGMDITGRVLLCLAKPKVVRAILLKIQGVANVEWSESDDNGEKKNTTYYKAQEEYFKIKLVLAGGVGETEIPIGDHVYSFSSRLPPYLPSSFEGLYGNVRYFVRAVMDRPWKIDHEVKVEFKVEVPIYLNYGPEVEEPIILEDQKKFFNLFQKSEPLKMSVSIPRAEFIMGQAIPLTIEVENKSSVEVKQISCKLKKEIRFIARHPYHKEKVHRVKQSKLAVGGVSVNASKSWREQLPIPHIPHQNLDPCSIIKICYTIEVTAKVSGFHRNLGITIPIKIGTVLLKHPPAEDFSEQHSSFPPISTPYPTGSVASDLPPYNNNFEIAFQPMPSAPPPNIDLIKTTKEGFKYN